MKVNFSKVNQSKESIGQTIRMLGETIIQLIEFVIIVNFNYCYKLS